MDFSAKARINGPIIAKIIKLNPCGNGHRDEHGNPAVCVILPNGECFTVDNSTLNAMASYLVRIT
jgi:hypothetical protein